MKNNIYIFKPSKYWYYCGGMIVVSAASYEAACEKAESSIDADGDFKFRKTDFDAEPSDNQELYTWVLFQVVDTLEGVDLCEVEYNYA